MIEYEMMGHRIPDRIILKNTDWFKEGCLAEIEDWMKHPEYLEGMSDKRSNYEN